MPYEPLEEKRIYQHAEALADSIWTEIDKWDWFAKKAVGLQLVKATDSIGANIAEAGGRFHPNDVRNFLFYARGSLRETKYWLRRCLARKLMPPTLVEKLDCELEQMARELSESINHQKRRACESRSLSRNDPTT